MAEFRQVCNLDPDPISYFLTPTREETITKSLYNANGKFGNIFVSATDNQVTVCERSSYGQPVPVTFRVGDSPKAVVVDVDICVYKNDKYGIAVAINEPRGADRDDTPEEDDGFMTKKEKAAREERVASRHSNNVCLYVPETPSRYKLVRRIAVFGEITCMRVLVNPVDMDSQREAFSKKIGAWPNIVAIGCENSSCFLGQFAAFDHESQADWHGDKITITATTDALKALIDKKGRFQYHYGTNNHSFMKDNADVSAIAYVPCWGLALVGLTNGCMVLVPLDGKSSLICMTVQYATRINFISVLEPEYDPTGGFFIFSARDRAEGSRAALAIFSHKIERKKDGDSYAYEDASHVIVPMIDGAKWLNVHAVVKRRRRREADVSSEDTTGDSSQLPAGLDTTQHANHDGMERTMLFYSYLTLRGEMRGGIFDLNSFYSRRMSTQQVKFDSHLQHFICTQFVLEVPNTGQRLLDEEDLTWVTCDGISRYISPLFDREPLFTPMAAHLRLSFCTRGAYVYGGRVESLQFSLLDQLSRSIGGALAQSDVALSLLEYTGLLLAPTTRKERLKMEERPVNERVPTELDAIMRALVSETDIRMELIKFIDERADRKQRLHIGRWMFNELRDTVARMDEAIAPLFDSVSPDSLSQETERLLEFCPQLFKFAELVFWRIRARGAELLDDTPKLRYTRKMHAQAAFDLRLFLACVWWFTQKLPLCEGWTHELMGEMAVMNDERRERAEKQRHPLFIDSLLSRLHERTMDDALWRGVAQPIQWYPPQLFYLVSLLRLGDATLADRAALLFYFLMDLDETVRIDREKPEEERRSYPIKGSLVSQFLVSEAGELLDGQMRDGMTERWESDMKGRQMREAAIDRPIVSRLTPEEKKELEALLNLARAFRKLQRIDEDRMKFLFSKQDYGIYRFNVFLIKKGRYPEVEDLEVPRPNEKAPHKIVEEYAKYKDIAMKQKALLPPPTFSDAYAAPYALTKKPAESPVSADPNMSRLFKTGHVTLVRGKTPKKLTIYKQRASSAAGSTSVAAAAGSTSQHSLLLQLQQTPPSARGPADTTAEEARINMLMATPAMRLRSELGWVDEDEVEEEKGEENDSNMAPDEAARVREALRTPRSRVPHASRLPNGGDGQGTPENAVRPPTTAPMSILKSARKDGGAPSAIKSKLRFAEIFDEKSISPRERDTTASTAERMSQPNFDDSFDDDIEHVKSMISNQGDHSAASDESTNTRLNREIYEAEMEMRGGGEEKEVIVDSMEGEEKEKEDDEQSMESGDEGSQSVSLEYEEEVAQKIGETFNVYVDRRSDVGSSSAESTDSAANAAFVKEEEEETADAARAATKTPPPTPEEEEEEEAANAADLPPAKTPPPTPEEDEQEVSAAAAATKTPPPTPEEGEEGEGGEVAPVVDAEAVAVAAAAAAAEEEEEEDVVSGEETESLEESTMEEVRPPTAVIDLAAAAAIVAAEEAQKAAADVVDEGEEEEEVQQQQQPQLLQSSVGNETEQHDGLPERHGEEEMEADENSEQSGMEEEGEGEEEGAADTANETYTVITSTYVVSVSAAAEEKDTTDGDSTERIEDDVEEESAATPAVPAADEAAAAPAPHPEEEETPDDVIAVEEEKDEEEENLSRAETPAEEVQNLSRAETPAEEKEEEDEKEKEQPVEDEEEPKEDEEKEEEEEGDDEVFEPAREEEEVSAVAAAPAPAADLPPVPKPRTIYDNKELPMSLGLRSFVFMEDGIEKSFEEQRGSSDEEEEEEPNTTNVLSRLRTRSSSRLQKGEEEERAAAPAADAAPTSTRKRTVSRSRKDSERDAPGPSTRSPREKKEKGDDEEEEEEGGHLFTTTRTRVVEETFVERGDGVMQHTVKQSTKVIETADGIVVKEEKEDKETIEEEGEREIGDETDRATPIGIEAPEVKRTSSRAAAAASRSRVPSTSSRMATRASPSRKKKADEEEKDEEGEKKREERATTPVRTTTTPRRRKLMSESEKKEEEKKEEDLPEPSTPRRSARTRKPSECAPSTVPQESLASTSTPSKSMRRSTRTKTPSREPSAVPVSPKRRAVLKVDDEEEKKEEEDTVVKSPAKRGRPKKNPEEQSPDKKKEEEEAVVKTPGKRGRPRKNPEDEQQSAAAAAAPAAPPVPRPRRLTSSTSAAPAAAAASTPSTRKRTASESAVKAAHEEEKRMKKTKKEEKKGEESKSDESEGEDPLEMLRKRREQGKKELAEQKKREAATKRMAEARRAKLSVIREGKKMEENKEEEEDDDQPSTSRAALRSASTRKRSQSEATGTKDEEKVGMKTPNKKKAKADKEEEESAIDQSMLRRSSRRATMSTTSEEGLKTPSKTPAKKK